MALSPGSAPDLGLTPHNTKEECNVEYWLKIKRCYLKIHIMQGQIRIHVLHSQHVKAKIGEILYRLPPYVSATYIISKLSSHLNNGCSWRGYPPLFNYAKLN